MKNNTSTPSNATSVNKQIFMHKTSFKRWCNMFYVLIKFMFDGAHTLFVNTDNTKECLISN
jgi:hypothetical protein